MPRRPPGLRFFTPVEGEDEMEDFVDYNLALIGSMRNTLTHMRASLVGLRTKIKELKKENELLVASLNSLRSNIPGDSSDSSSSIAGSIRGSID